MKKIFKEDFADLIMVISFEITTTTKKFLK